MYINHRKYIIICLLLATHLTSLASSMDEFLKSVQKAEGSYRVLEKNSVFCDDSDIRFIGSDKSKGFRIGAQISFGPLSDKVQTSKSTNSCHYTKSFKYTKNSVTQVSKVHDCDKAHKFEEAVSTQTLTFKDDKAHYLSKESGIMCSFKKIKEIKK